MPSKAELCTMRLYPVEKQLSLKLAKYHNIRGRGRLFSKLMREEVERIKKERAVLK